MIRVYFQTALILSLFIAGNLANIAAAQGSHYPNKSIRFVVPFAPGGSTDVTARIIGQKVSEILKQPIFVENRAGAGASIGIQNIASSSPDGYSILVVSPSIIVNSISMGATAG